MENKETFEDLIKREGYPEGPTQEVWVDGVKHGIKWQQEQDKNKYSEEDIDCLLDYIRGNAIETNQGWQINGIVYTNKELLEKFKKK